MRSPPQSGLDRPCSLLEEVVPRPGLHLPDHPTEGWGPYNRAKCQSDSGLLPKAWRGTRVILIPISGKNGWTSPKDF